MVLRNVPQNPRIVDWYFDFVSPFAYLQSEQLERLPDHVTIRYQPVLFAGILNHWKQLGPAEIASKREFTYQHVHWLARHHEIPLHFPPAHPFNSLQALRLTHACNNDGGVVHSLFRQIWADGRDLSSADDWRAMTDQLKLPEADEMINRPEIKQQLRTATEDAVAHGVFGVPTFRVDQDLFWGFDSIDMFTDFLTDETYSSDAERQRLRTLPTGARRL